MIDQLVSPCRFESRRTFLGLRTAPPRCSTHACLATDCLSRVAQDLRAQAAEVDWLTRRVQFLTGQLGAAREEASLLRVAASARVRHPGRVPVYLVDEAPIVEPSRLRLLPGFGE